MKHIILFITSLVGLHCTSAQAANADNPLFPALRSSNGCSGASRQKQIPSNNILYPMKIGTIILASLALTLFAPCLHAAEYPTKTILGREWHTNAARKGLAFANSKFLKSTPEGTAHLEKMSALDKELNVIHEKHLNLFHLDPKSEEGKKVRAERHRQLDALKAEKEKAENAYQELKDKSPAYRKLLEKELEGWEKIEKSIYDKRMKLGDEKGDEKGD
jgi:hypothetical protein